ncbi:TM2 domain-containing protein [Acrasis kona]|uniref:TM2 domain-containing protein n=1 Tax=Acrasis kona TaxID=1008807 RepID=A0AAW2ZC32_9EUKA
MAGEKDIVVAYVLWLFLGYLGIHRFYLNRIVSGVIYLLTGGIFGIGWLVDICLIPGMVDEENAAFRQLNAYPQATVISTHYQQPSGGSYQVPQATYYN